ncbi:hypothetical protein P59_234 [Bacillus phage P59]|nr:hypothetical protein P59_005 [Bacillus phage P59]QIW88831.1 hypothetical protein P59_234 [Bacillus phage P59]
MSVMEKIEYVVGTYKFKGQQGQWSFLNEMIEDIQAEFSQELFIGDWGIHDEYDGTTSIYNADSEEVLRVHYTGPDFVGNPNSIYHVEIKQNVVAQMIQTCTCPLCGDGEMEYEALDNPKAMSTYYNKPTTHMWVCDQCPGILMEWHDTEDTKAVAERLK